MIHYWKSKFSSVRADQLKKINVPTPREVQDSLILKLEKSLAIAEEMITTLRETDEHYKSAFESSF
jgi:hypothetical protein